MKPSPVETRALLHVMDLIRLRRIMRGQHLKGHEEHGQEIDRWEADRSTALAEGGAELCDLLTYFERAGDVPPEVYAHLRAVAEWVEGELWSHP